MNGELKEDTGLTLAVERLRTGANAHDVNAGLRRYRAAISVVNEWREKVETFERNLRRFVAGAVDAKELR